MPVDSRHDTIYAVSTGKGRAAIAIVRVSGPDCPEVLARVVHDKRADTRKATLAALRTANGELLDRALVLKFDAPQSFTGEDMLEFQVTGSPAVLSGLLRGLSQITGLRPAEPGEFARRAFENGKLDLVEVEGLAAVIEAETAAQLRHAHRMATGETSRKLEEIRQIVLKAMSKAESLLDFSDVEDAGAFSHAEICEDCGRTLALVAGMLDGARAAERLRDGMSVVIAGAPNVGKSTLLNHLARREVAIVSAIPGTTRDTLDIFMEIDGFPIVVSDTAGLRETFDPLEKEGVRRSIGKLDAADLVLWLFEDPQADALPASMTRPMIRVKTKMDLHPLGPQMPAAVQISAKTGEGVDALLRGIADFASSHFVSSDAALVGTERQMRALREVQDALARVCNSPDRPTEIVAEDLRSAAFAMGRIAGEIDVEDVLGEVFSQLCVGK